MKTLIKNIVISIVIVYFVISIINVIYRYNVANEITHTIVHTSSNMQMHQETINLQENMTISELLKLNYYNGRLGTLNEIFNIIIISIIIGVLLGSIISLREFSKAKYILYFILGNTLLNTIFSIVIQANYLKNDIILNFFECYYESTKNTIVSYILIFIAIVLVSILISKIKVEKLNNELNKKE